MTARDLWLRVTRLLRRERATEDLEAEMRLHIELRAEANRRAGMGAADAESAARRKFGNRGDLQMKSRDAWGFGLAEAFAQDVRYALRTLRRTPAFTTAAVLTLALGIGATTVIFSVADHIALRPLPYPQADRLLAVHEVIEEMKAKYPQVPANASHFLQWRRECTTCEGIAAFRRTTMTRSDLADPERLSVVRSSANLFPMLGARAQIGRLFSDDDDQVGHEAVAIISDGIWRRAFGADAGILRRSMILNGVSVQVIGVLGADFHFPQNSGLGGLAATPSPSDVFVPLALNPREQTTPGEFDYSVIARVKDGESVARMQAQFALIEAGIATTAHAKYGMTMNVVTRPLREDIVGATGSALLMLVAAVAAVLAVVCVNLANLFLARYSGKRRESALRVALGARTSRLVAQAITESVVLATLGGGLGILLSRYGLRALLALAPPDLPRLGEVQLDGRVLAVAIVVSIITGFAFGILPALRFGSVDPGDVLKGGGRTSSSGRGARHTRQALIASQVGLSALLLVATGLFLSSFVHVMDADKGFAVEPLLALDVELPSNAYGATDKRAAFFDAALRRLAAVPGVTSTAMTSTLPLGGENQVDMLSLENDPRPAGERPTAGIRYISSGYFSALGITVRRGRDFAETDRGLNVVILSEHAARTLWPSDDPIGKRMVPGSNDTLSEVIGVVADVRTSSLEKEGSPIAYVPYYRHAPPVATVIVRTKTEPAALATGARDALRAAGPTVPIGRVRTLAQIVSGSVAQRRFQLLVLVLFAMTALATAGVGIYGIMSHSLVQRANEIGIRMALGANAAQIHRLALVEGLVPAVAGLAIGIVMSLALGRTFSALLFGVGAGDPLTLGCVSAVLVLLASLASYIPAHRAARGDPMEALRVE